MAPRVPEQGPVTRVLFVGDRPDDVALVRTALTDVDLVSVESLPEAARHVAASAYDCLLIDGEPDASGAAVLDALRATAPVLPVVSLGPGMKPPMLRQVVELAVQRRRALAALRQSESYGGHVLASLGEGILVHDLECRLVRGNSAAYDLLGPAYDDPSGGAARHGWGIVRLDGSLVPRDELPTARALRSGAPVTGVTIGVLRPDGRTSWVEVSAQPLTDGSAAYGCVTSCRDVTERVEVERTGRLHSALLDATGQAVVVTDADGLVVYWNPAATALFGWEREDPRGNDADAAMGLGWTAPQRRDRRAALAHGGTWIGEAALGDGYVACTATALADTQGSRVATVLSCTDVTDRVVAVREAQRIAAAVASPTDAVVTTAPDGVVTAWNDAAFALFGYAAEDAVGRPLRHLLATTDDVGDVVATRKDGTRTAVRLTATRMLDATGAVVAVSTVAHDVSTVDRTLGELRYSALHDTLTGLPNRSLLTDRLAQAGARARRHGGSIAVLFVDIDDFKLVNDAAGHAVGDAVLVEVASRISAAVREEDTVARFGGDEFVVMSAAGTIAGATATADRVLAALRPAVEVAGHRLHVSASIGIATAPPGDVETLLSSADAAMYDAKARGRGRVRVFDAALAEEAAERLELSTDLRDALDQDLLSLHYQPIVDLATGALVGLEALARWDHPRRGPLSPDQFVGLADDLGIAGVLDRWALRRATREFAALRASGAVPHDCYVSVNISARSLRDNGLEAVVRDAVAAGGLPHGALLLELTETGLMDDPVEANALLLRLRESGVGVAIDDFGTGYSSLAYLGRFSVATLKIDRSFIERMLDGNDDLAIVAAITDLARAVGVRTVAEGIENDEQARLLRRLGCDAGQGFLWSPAVAPAEVAELVAQQARGRFPVVGATPPKGERRGDDELAGLSAMHGFTRLLALHREGASPTTIAAALNAEEFKTPRGNRWHRTTVARAIAVALNPYAKR
ncbi:MAG TPA: EAL domain-containing protein [Frankiaceae bacterium]|nr:EAL domain-containing protein [Frankiaceae bacterium]